MSVYFLRTYPHRSAFFTPLTSHALISYHAPTRRRPTQVFHRPVQSYFSQTTTYNSNNGQRTVSRYQEQSGQPNIQRIETIKNLNLNFTGPLRAYSEFREQQLRYHNILEEQTKSNEALSSKATEVSVDTSQINKTPMSQPQESSPVKENSFWQSLRLALTT